MPEKARRYIAGLPRSAGQAAALIYPNASHEALELLGGMLCWDPSQRCTVAQALSHPYLAAFHNPEAEPVATTPFDFNGDNTAVDAHDALFNEVCRFRPELERQAAAARAEGEALAAAVVRRDVRQWRRRVGAAGGRAGREFGCRVEPAVGNGRRSTAAAAAAAAAASPTLRRAAQQCRRGAARTARWRRGGRAEWDSPLKCELARVGERGGERERRQRRSTKREESVMVWTGAVLVVRGEPWSSETRFRRVV